ncbi:MAG: hypothetical protein N3E52_05630 [Candidatus Bathyarchaeota archaeon]|nr:hypothetical protein [Candidatus Bathyarchaeota archaeon]
MNILRVKSKRNRAVILMLLPAIIFIWVIGWSLYWIGQQKDQYKINQSTLKKKEHVHLIPIVFEDPLETRNK